MMRHARDSNEAQARSEASLGADYDALLMDYASGALSPAEHLVVGVHAQLRPEAAGLIDSAEVMGGAFLEMLEPVAMTTECLSRGRQKGRRRSRVSECEARVALALAAPDALRWGWLAPGIRRHRLPMSGASLLRVAPGRQAPRHDHDGQELTLVLRGQLVDDAGAHSRGDIVFAGPGDAHAPRAGGTVECICLVSMAGSWRLADWTQRLASRFFSS